MDVFLVSVNYRNWILNLYIVSKFLKEVLSGKYEG